MYEALCVCRQLVIGLRADAHKRFRDSRADRKWRTYLRKTLRPYRAAFLRRASLDEEGLRLVSEDYPQKKARQARIKLDHSCARFIWHYLMTNMLLCDAESAKKVVSNCRRAVAIGGNANCRLAVDTYDGFNQGLELVFDQFSVQILSAAGVAGGDHVHLAEDISRVALKRGVCEESFLSCLLATYRERVKQRYAPSLN